MDGFALALVMALVAITAAAVEARGAVSAEVGKSPDEILDYGTPRRIREAEPLVASPQAPSNPPSPRAAAAWSRIPGGPDDRAQLNLHCLLGHVAGRSVTEIFTFALDLFRKALGDRAPADGDGSGGGVLDLP